MSLMESAWASNVLNTVRMPFNKRGSFIKEGNVWWSRANDKNGYELYIVGVSYVQKKRCFFTDGHVPTEDEVRQVCKRIKVARVHLDSPSSLSA